MNEENQLTDIENTSNLPIARFTADDFRNIFYLLNAKPDRESRFYSESKIVSLTNIFELNSLVQSKLNNHQPITSKVSIVVTLDDNKILEFEFWKQFEEEKWHTSAKTKSILITWDFTIQLPDYQMPQRHTVKLRIGSKLNPKELLELMLNHEDEKQLHEAFAHSICSVDFINPIISSEMFLIIENWHKALPNNLYTSKVYEFLTKHTGKFNKFISLLVFIGGCAILFGLSKSYLNLMWSDIHDKLFYSRIFGGLLISLVFLSVLSQIGRWWAYQFERYIDKIRPVSFFKLTKGDENADIENKKKNDGIVRNLVLKLIVTIIFNVFAFCSIKIWDYLINFFAT